MIYKINNVLIHVSLEIKFFRQSLTSGKFFYISNSEIKAVQRDGSPLRTYSNEITGKINFIKRNQSQSVS